MPTEKPRYTIIVDEELLKKIDDFRFTNRYPSRSAATLDLIRLGMKTLEEERQKDKIQSELDAYRAELEVEHDSKTSQASDGCAENSKMA